MAINIKAGSNACEPECWVWSNSDDTACRSVLTHAERIGNRYYCKFSPWDCVGDFLVWGLLSKKSPGSYQKQNGITLKLINSVEFFSRYYRPETLLQFYSSMKSDGWNIIIENEEDNMNNTFKMECPSFEEFMAENTQETGLLPVKGAIVPMNTVLSGLPDRHAREYAHPVDTALVRVLDNPAVNTVFKSFVDMTVDANYGSLIATAVPVNETTFPVINDIVDHCVKTLRIKRPYVVVSGSVGFNAITMGSDEEPYIVLGNFLTTAMSEDQLRFVIGHECGHIAMGHVIYHTVAATAGNLANAIPVVGPVVYNTASLAIKAWSRRSEITADRAGLLCCGSVDLAKRTLMQVEMGFMRTDNLDIDNYVQTSRNYQRGGILRRVGEYTAEHPLLAKRIQALDAFAQSELFYHVTNQIAPVGAMNDHQLTQVVENMIKVL